MAGTAALMGLGMPAGQAEQIGWIVKALTATGTTQGAGVAIGKNSIVQLTTAAGQTASVLPANVDIGWEVIVYNMTSTAGLVFPPSGGTIDNGSANASVSIAQNRGRLFIKVSATAWLSFYGA